MSAEPSKTIRMVIADDHALFRDGLRRLLETEPGFRVIGEASDGEQAVALVRKLKPDILLLDMSMPRRGGMDALRDLMGSEITTRIIVLAASLEKENMVRALQLGARGVVLKESTSQVLLESIHQVVAGHFWVGSRVLANLVEVLQDIASGPPERPPREFGLTAREREVVEAVVAGLSNKEIAQKFSLSEQTVKHHLTNIFDKLGVYSRLELAMFAVHHRLVPSR